MASSAARRLRNGHFAWKCYIFVHFSSTPTSILNLTILQKKRWNIDSNSTLSVRKYCQLFTHESNIFLGQQYVIPPIQTNRAQMPKNVRIHARNSPFVLRHVDPSNTSMPGPTPLTIPNDSSIAVRTSAQLPLVTMRPPKSPPKLSLPFDDHHPHLIHPSLDRPHSPPKTASRSNQPFCQSTLCGQTDRPTDRPGECSVPWALRSLCR